MKKLLGAVSVLALAAGAGTALAVEEATGAIESLDQEQMTLMLDTGQTFSLPEDVSVEGLETGDEVTVVYEEENGELRATAIEVADVGEDEPLEEEPAAEAMVEEEAAEEAAE